MPSIESIAHTAVDLLPLPEGHMLYVLTSGEAIVSPCAPSEPYVCCYSGAVAVADADDLCEALLDDLAEAIVDVEATLDLDDPEQDPTLLAHVDLAFLTAGGATGGASGSVGLHESEHGSAVASGCYQDYGGAGLWADGPGDTVMIGRVEARLHDLNGRTEVLHDAATAAWRAGPDGDDVRRHVRSGFEWTEIGRNGRHGRVGVVPAYGGWWFLADGVRGLVDGGVRRKLVDSGPHTQDDARRQLAAAFRAIREGGDLTGADFAELAEDSDGPSYAYDDEHGGGIVYSVPMLGAWAVVDVRSDSVEPIGGWYDYAKSAAAAAEEAAEDRDETPDYAAVVSAVGCSEERAEAIVEEVADQASGGSRPLVVWVDRADGSVHTSEPDWLLDLMDWPSSRVRVCESRQYEVSHGEAARLILDALSADADDDDDDDDDDL